MTSSNLDARAFLTEVVRPLVEAVGGRGVQHVVMNLPASAIDFLGPLPLVAVLRSGIGADNAGRRRFPSPADAMAGWVAAGPPPTVHCYCFAVLNDTSTQEVLAVRGHIGRVCANPRMIDAKRGAGAHIQRVDAALGVPVDRARTVVTHVRSVSPTKDMFCCAFPLPVRRGHARERASGATDDPAPAEDAPPPKRRPAPAEAAAPAPG